MKTGKKAPDNKHSQVPSADLFAGDGCTVFGLGGNQCGLLASVLRQNPSDGTNNRDFGFKAMMKAVSILTSRGGRSRNALVSFSTPADAGYDPAPEILKGITEAGEMAGIGIARGESFGFVPAAVNIALFGNVENNQIIGNSASRPGDIIYLTGCTGDSLAGAEILRSKNIELLSRFPGLAARYGRPVARFDILQEIRLLFSPGSMTHVSRGLAADLKRLCLSGGGGFAIEEEKIPISRELLEFSRLMKKNPSGYALNSGDELELLFTSSKDLTGTMSVLVNNIPVRAIGTVTGNGFHLIKNGRKTILASGGR